MQNISQAAGPYVVASPASFLAGRKRVYLGAMCRKSSAFSVSGTVIFTTLDAAFSIFIILSLLIVSMVSG
jgi:hypothetical protein